MKAKKNNKSTVGKIETNKKGSIGISLYPNPSHSVLNIKSENKCSGTIYNQKKQVVKELVIAKGISNVYIGDMEAGSYVLKTVNGKMSRIKFTKL